MVPITLGCPSCSKRFKARGESAGKRVKCKCGTMLQVPTHGAVPQPTVVAAAKVASKAGVPAAPPKPPGK